jgi:hypothetical protein
VLRVIAGLWSRGSGSVTAPPPARCFFLPQKPYMPVGTLREQLLFPEPPGGWASAAAAARGAGRAGAAAARRAGAGVGGEADEDNEEADGEARPLLASRGDGSTSGGDVGSRPRGGVFVEMLPLLRRAPGLGPGPAPGGARRRGTWLAEGAGGGGRGGGGGGEREGEGEGEGAARMSQGADSGPSDEELLQLLEDVQLGALAGRCAFDV